MFWSVFDQLSSTSLFTAGQVKAALEHNLKEETMRGLLKNLTDSHDKSRFLPIPFDVRLYVLCDVMLFGNLPVCPACGGCTLLGTPSGWVSCRGWENKSKDVPCTWHSKRGGEPFGPRNMLMSRTGRPFEMPSNAKPKELQGQGWVETLMSVDASELRKF